MPAATNFLYRWIALSAQKAPSVTVCSSQPPTDATPPGTQYQAGIVSFGWGINGSVVPDAAGNGVGLHFPEVATAFSDRPTSAAPTWPDQQHFDNANSDRISYTLTVVSVPGHRAARLALNHLYWLRADHLPRRRIR